MALDLTAHVNALAERIHAALDRQQRVMVALAGAPGSGKSTLAAELARRLRDQRVTTEVVPMDGFHLDNAVLDARGLRGRKGAPETFDAAGFLYAVSRLRAGEEVVTPIFDRAREVAIAGAQVVSADCRAVICEGSYLLFDQPPWSDLYPLWDIRAQLDVPLAELRGRLIQRWLTHGLSRATATRRAETNDIPNARHAAAHSLPPDLILIPKAL